MNRFKKLLKDKRGASLVYVIVAAAIIILLGAATTTVAYANLQATKVQTKSDNNFYSADSVMNAIVGGLEDDFSKAYDKAYTKMVATYGHPEQLEAKKKKDPNFDPNKLFKEMWRAEMSAILNDESQPTDQEVSGFYSIERLQTYVQQTLSEDVNYTISAVGGHNIIDKIDDYGLIIRNLHVTYEDDTGYYDEITTDVKLMPPELGDLTRTYEADDILLVADKGFESLTNTHITMEGNIYLGKGDDGCAINIGRYSTAKISNPDELIAGGNVLVNDSGKLSLRSSQNDESTANFWIENISVLREAFYSANGNSYVSDDLESNGAYSTVTLGGTYMGFNKIDDGEDKAHAKSSSININGAHTTLDFRNLKQLVIAGSSYLSASDVAKSDLKDSPDNHDIELGEAFSVKSNQIAYLVDEKGFANGFIKNSGGLPVFTSNPMSYDQYKTLSKSSFESGKDWKETILNEPLSFDKNKKYSTFKATDVVPVFSNKDGGTVYLYLTFANSNDAGNYFNEISKTSSLTAKRLRTYTEQYIKDFTINESTKFYTNSNFIRTMAGTNDKDYSKGIKNGNGTITYDENNIQRIVPNGDSDINGLGYNGGKNDKLLSSIPTISSIAKRYPNEITKVTFAKKINEDQLETVINAATSAATDQNTNNKIKIIDNGFIITGTDGSKAILIDNEGKAPYEVKEEGSGIIIATGDVKIENHWSGTFIVKGRVFSTRTTTESDPTKFIYKPTVVSSALSLYFKVNNDATDEDFMGPINAFQGYKDFNPNRATQKEGDNANIIKNCITFTNWNKE